MIQYDTSFDKALTQKTFRQDAERIFEEWLVWCSLQEELLAAKIDKWFDDQKERTLAALDGLEGVYDNTKKSAQLIDELLSTNLVPFQRFKRVGEYRFATYTFPVNLADAFRKAGDPLADAIKVTATVDPTAMREALDQTSRTVMNGGGQSALNTLRIDLPFQVVDKGALKALDEYHLKLSIQLGESLSSKIKYELAEGIRNFEGIPEIRDRILSVYDKPVTVVVPPKFDADGNITRKGYTYEMDSKHWASVVARTEVTRAFISGRLEAYRQSGVVNTVQLLTASDERVCYECGSVDGNIYKLEESYDIIPIHGSCRCTFVPYIDEAMLDSALATAGENVADEYASVGVEGTEP